MKVESDIALTCSVCRAEGPHKLLYLSQRLRASECMNCGTTRIYSGHIYAEYARDLTERVAWLPFRLAGEAARSPTAMLLWPAKAFRELFELAKEMNQVAAFERRRHHHHRA